jgi:hypothetical protein
LLRQACGSEKAVSEWVAGRLIRYRDREIA